MIDLYPIIDGFLEGKYEGFQLAANTEILVLELLDEHGHHMISTKDLMAWVNYFSKLRHFEVRIMTKRPIGGVDVGLISNLIPSINSLFVNAMGKIVEGSGEFVEADCMMCFETWFWEEKDGGTLKTIAPSLGHGDVMSWGPGYHH